MIIAFQIILLFIIGISFIGLVAEKEKSKRLELFLTLLIGLFVLSILILFN